MNDDRNLNEEEVIAWFNNVVNEIYEKPINFIAIENELKQLKLGGALTYENLEFISRNDNWPTFGNWYRWPTKTQIKKSLLKTKDLFIGLREKTTLPSRDPENPLKILFDIIKNIELVSIILRFIDPNNFAIYSPPVAYYLKSSRGVNYIKEYMNYIETLRGYKDVFGLDKIAHVDMFVWALVKAQDRQLESFNEKKEIHRNITDIAEHDAINNILPKKIKGKADLEVAEYFKSFELYSLAARSAGVAFEDAINKQCEKHMIYDAEKSYKAWKERDLKYKIIDLVNKTRNNVHESDLHKIRKFRNYAFHHDDYLFKMQDIEDMVNITRLVENW